MGAATLTRLAEVIEHPGFRSGLAVASYATTDDTRPRARGERPRLRLPTDVTVAQSSTSPTRRYSAA